MESPAAPVSITQDVYQRMLDCIQTGEWAVGEAIPSERNLLDQFGVSRIAVREAISMLRGLGLVEVSHGRRTRVRGASPHAFDQLLPLMLADGGSRTLDQVFQLRLAIESHAAELAATERTNDQLAKLASLAENYREQSLSRSSKMLKTDLAFHLQIAHATGNPLFPTILEATSRFVEYTQFASCKDDDDRVQHAVLAHEAIVEAIAARDSHWARQAMEAHLRYSGARGDKDMAE